MMRRSHALTFAGVLALGLSACDFGGESPKLDPDAATIREVRVEPNPVAVGDTALFTCVVAVTPRPG